MTVQRGSHPTADVLKAFGLGKLDERSAAAVRKHVEQCEVCRKTVTALSAVRSPNPIREAQGRSATSAPADSATRAEPRLKPPPGPTTLFNLPPELADNPQYEIVRELGRGGMGVVYLAKNKLMDRPEVLKVINKTLLDRPGAVERFLREIRSAAKLSHANVVTAHSALQLGDLLVFAMEYVDGQDLAVVVKDNGPLSVPHACFYVQQAAWGLQHAFEKGMVHRDIKPQNLILARDGRKHVLKVLDFGLAKATQEKSDDTGLTGEGNMLGTPDYMAPEQTRDAASADIRADIYSLGCTLYFLLSGQRPFKGKNLFEIMQAHQSMTATALNQLRPEVPAELAAVVRKMMAKDRGQRYQTPLDVVQALGPFVKQGGSSSASSQLPSATVAKKPAPPASDWSSLTKGDNKSVAPRERAIARPRRAAAGRSTSKKMWLIGGGIGFGVLLLVLLVTWASGVFKVKTKNGTIVLEGVPAGAEVLVDGETVTLKSGDGKTITIAAGKKHQLKVRKEGFTVFAKEVEIEAGNRRTIRVRLEPLSKPGGSPSSEPATGPTSDGSFFNGKDLTGWEGLPDYWHVEDGAIVGRCPPGRPAPTFLISTKTFKDFDLKFQVRRKDGFGNSGVQFRSQIKDRAKYTVVGPQVEIDSAAFRFPPGSLVTEPTANPLKEMANAEVKDKYKDAEFNDFHVRCVGKHVTIEVNGVTAIDGDYPSLPEEGVIAWQIHGDPRRTPKEITFRNIAFTDLSTPAPAEGFVPLFNGRDLAGWKTHPIAPGNWRVKDGVLIGSGNGMSHLFTERDDWRDFHLRVETRINDGGNGGLYFRTEFSPQFPNGYEAQIDSTHSDPIRTGSLYPSFGKITPEQRDRIVIKDMLVKPEEWFTYEVIAQGNRIILKVNGKTTVDFVDENNPYRIGHFALQQHSAKTIAAFRKIEVKELK